LNAPDDIHLALEDGVLSISAKTCSEDKTEENGRVIRQEDISANFSDGALKLKAPDDVPQNAGLASTVKTAANAEAPGK